ncbi:MULTISPECIES: DUF7009 family protein [Maribacter]|uniref:Uncharacterized protein n=1 Tax=Maribacter flavus TaxID=1658664 RepID=A0ABU7IKD1_9FLAO|nr:MULTISPECIES: hypothetical protein [Maribacter]MDC6406287.1 hypothetical protein [Maribacter sp. PR66]MEE1973407.1 hypothetical protein [Maribacter flavus]
MKIRIQGNTVRYRLTKSEVETLAQTGYYKEETLFGERTFVYAIKADQAIPELHADYVNDTITMYLNKDKSSAWPKNEIVGFSSEIKTSNGNTLSLLLEKDFVCMDNTDEDQSDNYPNPKLSK